MMSEGKFDAKKVQLAGKAKDVLDETVNNHQWVAEDKTGNLARIMKV